jgi:hypothetical protein
VGFHEFGQVMAEKVTAASAECVTRQSRKHAHEKTCRSVFRRFLMAATVTMGTS